MVDGTLLCGRNEFPIWTERGIDPRIPGDNEAIDSELSKQSIRTGLVPDQIFGFVQVDLAMNPEIEFARDSGGKNWTVAVDEMQTGPH